MRAMDMVPVSQSQASVSVSNHTLETRVKTQIVQMIVLVRVFVTRTLGSALAIKHQSSSRALVVSFWIAQLAAMNRMASATGTMASASVRWAILVRNANFLLGVPLTRSIPKRLIGGLSGISQVGFRARQVSCCMHSSVACVTHSPALTLEAVLLAAKVTPTSIRSDTATTTWVGTTPSTDLDGPSVSLITMSRGYIVAANRCTASRWPSAALSRKRDGLNVATPSGATLSTILDGQDLVMQAVMLSSLASSGAKGIP